jgi:hypothetical protein
MPLNRVTLVLEVLFDRRFYLGHRKIRGARPCSRDPLRSARRGRLCIHLARGSQVAGHARPARVDADPAVGALIADECVSPIQCVSPI